MPNTPNEPTTSDEVLDLRTPPTRTDRAAQLLDQAMERVASQLKSGTCNGGLLREVVALAKACGVELASNGQPLSHEVDDVLASLADLDPSVYDCSEYEQ